MSGKSSVVKPKFRRAWSTLRAYVVAHRRGIFWVCLIFLLWLTASYIFFRRFPNYIREPNFYAEDGQVFARNILLHGFWDALLTTFNGYYIWGMYILQKLGFILNSLIYDGQLVTLPKAFAIVSYSFLGAITTLPIVLFRKHFSKATLLLIFLFTLFVPMISSDYTLIGTIGTTKFAFVYIAFLLLVYRHLLDKGSQQFYWVDVALIICLYTNATVYFMLPFALLRYIPEIRKKQFVTLLKTRSVQSLIVLGLLALPQLYIVYRNGIPALPGYLDNPFNPARTIEIFLSRSYIYTVLFPVNKFLNDTLAVIIMLFFTASGLLLIRKQRVIFIFGYITIFLATALFVLNRTGISDYFAGYASGGPDQFFFTQNWIFAFILSLVIVSVIDRIRSGAYRAILYTIVVLGILLVLAPRSSTYGRNNFQEINVGNIYQNAQAACLKPGKTIDLPVYPVPSIQFTDIPREDICTRDVLNYRSPVLDLNLRPADNNYIANLGTTSIVNQTFVSPRNNLDGIVVYFSTFAMQVRSPYDLLLYDGSCKTLISRTSIPVRDLDDNAFQTIKVPKIKDSADKHYCFSVRNHGNDPLSPLAIQLSPSGIYPQGQATINGHLSDRDVVFELHYEEKL